MKARTRLNKSDVKNLFYLRVVCSDVEDDALRWRRWWLGLVQIGASWASRVWLARNVDRDEIFRDLWPLDRARRRGGDVEHLGPESANGNNVGSTIKITDWSCSSQLQRSSRWSGGGWNETNEEKKERKRVSYIQNGILHSSVQYMVLTIRLRERKRYVSECPKFV